MGYETEVGTFVGLGCMAMLSLALIVILISLSYRRRILEKENKIQAMHQEKQIELFRTSVEAEERQKEKLGNNLHDEIIPILTVIGRNIDKHIHNFKAGKFNPEHLKKEVDAIEQTVEGVRAIAHDLIPKMLFSFGLIKTLSYYIGQINELENSAADFENKTSFGDEIPFSKNDQRSIYTVCLELLNNLYKHAHYNYLKVTLECIDNVFVIEFMHDGKSITNEEIELLAESKIGLGLKSIQARLLILNGTIDYSRDTDISFIKLDIPIIQ
jgi:signal transduction histidine kinase